MPIVPVVPIALVVLLLLLLVQLPNSSPLNQKIFPKRIYNLYTFSIHNHLISNSYILFSPTYSTYNLSAIQFPIQISSALNSIHLFHDVKTLSLYLLLSTSFFLKLSSYTSYFRIQFYSFVFSLKRQRSCDRYNRDIPPSLYCIFFLLGPFF